MSEESLSKVKRACAESGKPLGENQMKRAIAIALLALPLAPSAQTGRDRLAEEARINSGQRMVELVCTKRLEVYAVRIDPIKRAVEINGIPKTVVELEMRPNLIVMTFEPGGGFFNINRVTGFAFWSRDTALENNLELHCEAGAKPKF